MSESIDVAALRTTRINAVLDEVHSESERASVILASAEMDRALRALLEEFFLPPNQCSGKYGFTLFGPEEPAGTLSARIELSYRAGLIPEWCQKEAHILRRVRNEFAHQSLGYSFASSPTRELMSSLSIAGQLQAHATKADFPLEYWQDPKNVFAITAGFVIAEIDCAYLNLLEGNPKKPELCQRGLNFK